MGVGVPVASDSPFELDEDSGIPIWIQLRNRLAYLVDSGYYKSGDRLPTVRALAAELNVNYHTVNKVYTSLEHDGYISSKRGRGAFVSKQPGQSEEEMPGDIVLAEAVRQCMELGHVGRRRRAARETHPRLHARDSGRMTGPRERPGMTNGS